MANRVCPPWVGYLLLNPLRKLMENPRRIFAGWVGEGVRVLEPGCGSGYFTLPLAEMTGSSGRVYALDVQDKMLDIVRSRAEKAGLSDRIDLRLTGETSLNIDDLAGTIDFAAAMHMVHEVPDQEAFFREIYAALKSGGGLLMVEPKGHTKKDLFREFLNLADREGFYTESLNENMFSRQALLRK